MTTATAHSPMDHLALDVVLPWHEDEQQRERFQKLLKRVVIPLMALMIVMPLLPDFNEKPVEEKIVTQLALDPPEVVEPEPEPETPEPEQPKPQKKPPPKADTAGSKPNIKALSQQLSSLRTSVNTSRLQKKNVFVSSSGKVQKSSRSLLGKKNATASSSGIKSSDITINSQGAPSLGGHESGTIDSPVAGFALPDEQAIIDPDLKRKRDAQSIRRTMERYKGSLYTDYLKAHRKNPNLQGAFIINFKILPSGQIVDLKLNNSDLDDPWLEKLLLKKIGQFRFDVAENTVATPVTYTYNFLPS